MCEKFFHDVPFEAHFASDMAELQPMSAMPGVDGFTMKVDALYKVCAARALPLCRFCAMKKSALHWILTLAIITVIYFPFAD